ncbi:SpaA isopeptide-forming pilin-related protein [Bacillus spongiae]|uniref:SpaA isopeptide-forming pilin-related protein n=1 Tax=Bacillus spongiae TaxID=2683610 RepID=A0ABU8HCC2_9BACI
MKKLSLVAMTIMMLIQTIFTSAGLPIRAVKAQGNSSETIIMDVVLTDGDGNVLDGELNPDNIVSEDSTVMVSLEWKVRNTDSRSKEGTYSYKLPDELIVSEVQHSKLISAGIEVGNVDVGLNGEISIKVDNIVEKELDLHGTFKLQTSLNKELLASYTELPISFSLYESEKVINVPIQWESETKKTEKQVSVEVEKNEEPSTVINIDKSTKMKEINKTVEVPSEIKESILTSVMMKDESGNIIHSELNPENRPSLGDPVEIEYTWELPNGHGNKDGDTFTFLLPDIFTIYNKIEGELLLNDGTSVGDFSIGTDREVVFTFNHVIEQRSNIRGNVKVWTEFKEETIGSVTREIVFPVIEGVSFTVPVVFQPTTGNSIEKKGMPNKEYNGEEIEWTIDFNKQLEFINDAILLDPIQNGLQFQEDSLKVYHLDIQLDNSIVIGNVVDPSEYEIQKLNGQDFQIRFGNINSAYRVVFSTDITDKDRMTYRNEAILSGANVRDLNTTATVSVGRGQPLQKRATHYDKTAQTITWEIKYNYDEKTIEKNLAKLTDLFSTSQEFIQGSIEVYTVSIDEHGGEESLQPFSDYTIVETNGNNKKGFDFQFNQNIDSAYKIIYKTRATDRVFEDERIINEVTTENGISTEAIRTISSQIIFKHLIATNYKEKTVKWQIPFNHDRFEMNQVVLEDDFSNRGLTFLPATLKIVNSDNQNVLGNGDYSLTENENGFTISFNHKLTEPHYIEYETIFDFDDRQDLTKNYLRNEVVISWQDEHGDEQTKETAAQFEPDPFTKNNGYKNGSYNAITNEITWNIGMNYNLDTLSTLKMVDYLLDGQELVEESIDVYKLELTGQYNGVRRGESLERGIDYEIERVTDSDGNPGFKLQFNKEITSAYGISYKTSLEDKLVKKEYHNTATLLDGEDQLTKLDANVSIRHGGEYTSKYGIQNGRFVDWTVNINFGQSKVSNVQLIDTPSLNQKLNEDSFHLFGTTISEDGIVTIDRDNELKLEADYTLNIDKDEKGRPTSFQVSFLNEIDSAYILEYQSYINAVNGDEVTNSVTFKGDQITTEETESSETITVKLSNGSAQGSGEIGKLEVTKIDMDSEEVLEGATFSLFDAESNKKIETLTTGEDGKATFLNLLYGDYLLIEDEAPEGYLVGINNHHMVTVGADNNEVVVENQKIIRSIEVTKVDKETKEPLEGATFELLKKLGDSYEFVTELTSNHNGKISKKDLDPGEYQLIEIVAPFGYQLDGTPIEFTIKENQTEKVDIIIENQIMLGAIELVKVDEFNQSETLSGVEFELLDDQGRVLKEKLTTNEVGIIMVDELRPGKYQFKETNTLQYYELEEAPIEFTIKKGITEAEQLVVTNKLVPGSVELMKVDKDNHSERLKEAEFEIRDESDNLIQAGLSTNEEGILVVKDLNPGNYQFVETDAPFGYELDATPIAFTIEKGQTEMVKVVAENKQIRGSVELTKIDEEDRNVKLAEAEFELQDESGTSLEKGITTNEAGIVVVNDLNPGTYQFVETVAPFGYELDATPIAFTIEKGQTEMVKVVAENKQIRGSVELTKIDEEDRNVKLAEAEFELQDESGTSLEKGLTTNEAGIVVVNDLNPGTYQFVETVAPFGYELDATPIAFMIEKGQTEMVKVVAENKQIRGSVELTKVDEEDRNVKLAEAEFELQDESGTSLEKGLTTNEAGSIVVTDLKPGKYQFVETKAPSGYKLDATPITFTIEIGQEKRLVLEVTNQSIEKTSIVKSNEIQNEQPLAPDELPYTGETLLMYLRLLGGIFITVGGGLLIFNKKKKRTS